MSTTPRIGRYAARRRLGSGGFATVWLAYDEQLDAPVAVKVLAENWSDQHEIRTRFVEEGRFLRRVESPHVVPVYDAGETDDGRPFLVMAYADQGSLADRLEAGPLTVGQAREVIRQVGAGLQALHDGGVIHRDVKPANVLFRTVDPAAGDAGVRAMVGDLGLGKALDTSSRLTMIGGTPAFVAPEQAQGETPDARADQYSLAVLAFLLLSGRYPWAPATLPAAATTDPGPALALSTGARPFADAVENVVMRGLARDRQWRFPTVSAFCEALETELTSPGAAEPGAVEPGTVTGFGTQVLPVDRDRTQPGVRPSGVRLPDPPTDGEEDGVSARAPRRRTGVLVALVALVLLGLSAVAGYAAVRFWGTSSHTVYDTDEVVAVTVPDDWEFVAQGTWTPGDVEALASLAVGTSSDWQTRDDGQGVFLALLKLPRLPADLPQHAECTGDTDVVRGTRSGYATRVVYAEGCPHGLTVEAVYKVSTGRVLWVQVRAEDRSTVTRVLDSVQVDGQ